MTSRRPQEVQTSGLNHPYWPEGWDVIKTSSPQDYIRTSSSWTSSGLFGQFGEAPAMKTSE